jgi:hypothetical protein
MLLRILAAFLLFSATFGSNNRKIIRSRRGLLMTLPTPGVIVGGGRIGTLLYELNDRRDVLLTDRNAEIPLTDGPIYVATRNNDLGNHLHS